MGTREEFERQCPFCGNGMRELVANRRFFDDFIIRKFRCQNCGEDVLVSSLRPVYKPLEELKLKQFAIVMELNALNDECFEQSKLRLETLERIEKLRKEHVKLNKKIDKVRRERKENE